MPCRATPPARSTSQHCARISFRLTRSVPTKPSSRNCAHLNAMEIAKSAVVWVFPILAIPEMFPNLMTKPNQPRPGPQHDGFPGSLSAADAGIFLDSPGFACGADHPDSASHSQICVYEAGRRSWRRAVSFVRLADWQLFQPSDRGPAGQAGHGG